MPSLHFCRFNFIAKAGRRSDAVFGGAAFWPRSGAGSEAYLLMKLFAIKIQSDH